MRLSLIIILLFFSTILLAQHVNGSFMFGGVQRDYTVYLPTGYTSTQSYPLVLNLHGYGSDRGQQAVLSNFNSIADTAGFLVVYPNGTLDATNTRFWNAAYGASVDDVGFLNALIDSLAQQYSVDIDRVYSTGLSNGAIMSHTLACELGNKLAAIASVAGTMSIAQYNNCTPNTTMPMLHVHGTADIIVPYSGNTVLLGVNTLVDFWRQENGLSNSSTTTNIPNTSTSDFSTVELIEYTQGSTAPVHLYKVTNGGHAWPGSSVNISGNTNQDFDASEVIWQFFSQHSRQIIGQSNIRQQPTLHKAYLLGANPVGRNLAIQLPERRNYRLVISNSLGQVVHQQNYEGAQFFLPVGEWQQGVYIIHILGKTRQTIRFVKG